MEKLYSKNGKETLQNNERRSPKLCRRIGCATLKFDRVWESAKIHPCRAREFVAFAYDEVNVTNIKKACEEHYGISIGDDMEIDVLAGEQGPSCQSMKHIKDLRLIYVRFIKRETLPLDNSEASTSVTNYKDSDFADSVLPRKKTKEISFQIRVSMIEDSIYVARTIWNLLRKGMYLFIRKAFP